jgi:hypothetical protein
MTLTEFLLARIAEDETDARAAYYEGQRWLSEEEAVVAADRDLEPVLLLDRKCDAEHAANWSPARVLAQCEANRRIIERAADVIGDEDPATSLDEDGWISLVWEIMYELALPYADHPDYREEWRP